MHVILSTDQTDETVKVVVTAGASMQIYHFLFCIVYFNQLKIRYQIFNIGDVID